ncbi:MAG: hypothetical protein KGD63_14655 [Candidatus Lokiarchaeota archaeon]|nr:hypothetical protein [Candidatus Lokiarchaeota archaeon]
MNSILSSTLFDSKELILGLKNRLISECVEELKKKTKKKIKKSQSEYYSLILDLIKQVFDNNKNLKKKSIIFFNEIDFKYFNQNIGDLKKVTNKNIIINQSDKIILGGFLIGQDDNEVVFNYDLSNLIRKNQYFIEIQFTKLIPDSGIKELQLEFESFINKNKKEIKEYLIKYDKI